MGKRLTLAQYRGIDLALFGVMLAVSEYLIVSAAARWFPGQPYAVSVTGTVVCIVLMRWGPWAALHAVLGGLVYCAASGGTGRQFLIYCAGNLLCLLTLPFLRGEGSERIRTGGGRTVVFALAVQLLMQLGRAAAAFVTGSPLSGCVDFFTTDALSLLFTAVIVWIARRLDGIFENQIHYLLRQQEARARGEEKRGI